MTYISILNCFDGLVIAADSLEEDGVNRKTVDKLVWYGKENAWGLAFGCSGCGTVISVFHKKVSELFLDTKILTERYNRDNIQQQLEAAITYAHEKYPSNTLEVIAGLWGRDCLETTAYHGYHGNACLGIVEEYGVAGMDGSLSNTLLSSMFDPSMSVAESVPLAVFVTAIMKEKAAGVGGPTKVMSYSKGDDDWRWYEPHDVAGLEKKYPLDGFYDHLLQYWAEHNPQIKRPIGRFPIK